MEAAIYGYGFSYARDPARSGKAFWIDGFEVFSASPCRGVSSQSGVALSVSSGLADLMI